MEKSDFTQHTRFKFLYFAICLVHYGYQISSLRTVSDQNQTGLEVARRQEAQLFCHGTNQLDCRIRGVCCHARLVRDHWPVLRVHGGQTEHYKRVPVGRQTHVRLPHYHVTDCQVPTPYANRDGITHILSGRQSDDSEGILCGQFK